MFLPVFGDPWSGSTYVRLPRSAPFHAPACEDPFAAYTPRHDQYVVPVAEPHCNCRSRAMARAAAAASDFSSRPQFGSHARHPAYAGHPLYHQQPRPDYHSCGHHHSPYAHAYAKAGAVPPCAEADDDEAYADQQQLDLMYGEPSYPYVSTTSRPASSHPPFRPASFAGTGHSVNPKPVITQHNRQASPHAAQALAAATGRQQPAASQWQQQQQAAQPPSVPVTPTSKGRQIKVQAAPSSQHVEVHYSTPQSAAQQQHPFSRSVQPARQLSRGEAATIIQSWWRMRRLACQRAAVKALAAAATQLNTTTAKFAQYKAESTADGSSGGHLSHKQYAELNELAMRVLLQLDATSCGVSELRTVRKRLTAAAIKLLDEIQGAYSAAVHSSMELSDAVVRSAIQGVAKAVDAPPAAVNDVASNSGQHQQTQEDTAQGDQQQREEQLQQENQQQQEEQQQHVDQQQGDQQQPQQLEDQQQQEQVAVAHLHDSGDIYAAGEAASSSSESSGAVEATATTATDAAIEPATALPEPAAVEDSSSSAVQVAGTDDAPADYTTEQNSPSSHDGVLQQDLRSNQGRLQQQDVEAGAAVEAVQLDGVGGGGSAAPAALMSVPAGVRIVLVYPGGRSAAATQTD